MTQSATVKPDADLLAEIKARDANYTPEMEAGIASPSCNDRRTLLRMLSACQARAEEAEKALIQSHVALTNSDAEPHAIVVVALGIVGNALAALGADGGGTKT